MGESAAGVASILCAAAGIGGVFIAPKWKTRTSSPRSARGKPESPSGLPGVPKIGPELVDCQKLPGERSRSVDWRVQNSGRCPGTPPPRQRPSRLGARYRIRGLARFATAIQSPSRTNGKEQTATGFRELGPSTDTTIPWRQLPCRPLRGASRPSSAGYPRGFQPPASPRSRNRNRSSPSSPLPLRRDPNRELDCRTGCEFPPGNCYAALSHVNCSDPGAWRTEQTPA